MSRTAVRNLLAPAIALLALVASRSEAGCGCAKPPPPPAPVRPQVAYAGTEITLIGPFQAGVAYTVTFHSSRAAGPVARTTAATIRRDLADGVEKAMLALPLPELPIGPVAITVVTGSRGATVLSIPETAFTAAPAPVLAPNT